MRINKKLNYIDAFCIAMLAFIITGMIVSPTQRAFEPFKNNAFGQTTEPELVYAVGGDAGEVVVVNATSNTILTIHTLSAGSVVFAQVGFDNIYWVVKGAGTTFDVIRIKGADILSTASYVNVCNDFNNAYEIIGTNSLSVICKQFGDNNDVQFLTVSNGAVTSNTTRVNWNRAYHNDIPFAPASSFSPILHNNLYHASVPFTGVMFRVGSNSSIYNATAGTVSGFEFNNNVFGVTANDNDQLHLFGSSGQTLLSVAPDNIAGASNGIAPYAVRDTNIVILPVQAQSKFIRMSLPSGNIIQNITLSAGGTGYGTANIDSDGSFTRLYKGNNGDDNFNIYFSNGTLITTLNPAGAIGTMNFMQYAGEFTLTEPSDDEEFCDLPENANILSCRLGGDGSLVGLGTYLVGNSTEGTGLSGITCSVGIVDCSTNDDIKTNGVGYLLTAVAMGIFVGMLWVASRSRMVEIPTFVWFIGTIAILGAVTAMQWVDPTFLVIGVIAIIGFAVAKARNIFGGGGSLLNEGIQ